jgi:hypothetical protein
METTSFKSWLGRGRFRLIGSVDFEVSRSDWEELRIGVRSKLNLLHGIARGSWLSVRPPLNLAYSDQVGCSEPWGLDSALFRKLYYRTTAATDLQLWSRGKGMSPSFGYYCMLYYISVVGERREEAAVTLCLSTLDRRSRDLRQVDTTIRQRLDALNAAAHEVQRSS